jgi:jumonji domain-containing protein 2
MYVPVEEWETRDVKTNVLCFQICSVNVGQVVWARHKNRRYYKGWIADISETQFYMVLFSDGSFSDDLYPGDIMVS